MVTVLQNGLVLLDVGSFWVQFYLGITLLAAVAWTMAERLRPAEGVDIMGNFKVSNLMARPNGLPFWA